MSAAEETGVDRARRLFAIVRDTVARGASCPRDAELAATLDCSEEQVCDAFAFLEAAGMVEHYRVVSLSAAAREAA